MPISDFNLLSWTFFDISPTFVVPLFLSFLILSNLVTPLIHLNILISATSNFFSCAGCGYLPVFNSKQLSQQFISSVLSEWVFSWFLIKMAQFVLEVRQCNGMSVMCVCAVSTNVCISEVLVRNIIDLPSGFIRERPTYAEYSTVQYQALSQLTQLSVMRKRLMERSKTPTLVHHLVQRKSDKKIPILQMPYLYYLYYNSP